MEQTVMNIKFSTTGDIASDYIRALDEVLSHFGELPPNVRLMGLDYVAEGIKDEKESL